MAISSTSYKAGESGNPDGRPKVVAEVVALARTHTAEAVQTLATVMMDKKAPPAARIGAAVALLDRGYGRPAQSDLLERIERLEEMLHNRAVGGNGRAM